MNKNKLLYEQPGCKILVVRFEDCFLFVSNGVNYSTQAGRAGGDDVYGENDGELF